MASASFYTVLFLEQSAQCLICENYSHGALDHFHNGHLILIPEKDT
jgi:hypothetical protein